MDRDELAKLLDLDPNKLEGQVELDIRKDDGAITARRLLTASNYAFHLDAWDESRGHALLKNYELRNIGLPHEALADFHAAAFRSELNLHDVCMDQRRLQYLQELMQTPQFEEMRVDTMLREAASELASTQLAKSYAELLQHDKEAQRQPPPKNEKERELQKLKQDVLLFEAVCQGLKDAEEAVDELNTILRGLGGDGGQDGKLDAKRVGEIFRRVRNSSRLKRICELAGRYRLLAQSKQRRKIKHGYDDMVGVVMDDEINRLLPEELAGLRDPNLRRDTLRRLVDKETMCYEYQGTEQVGKGPIIVCVDESGSMSGEPVCNAKAFALAMAYIARRQNRWCCLIGYAGGTTGTRCVLPPNKWDDGKLMDWLEHFYSGGTVMDVPLRELPTTYWKEINPPRGKTDLILITDGIVNVPSDMRDTFLAWKKRESVRCISLILAAAAGDLRSVSDEVFLINGIDINNEAVGRCLSL